MTQRAKADRRTVSFDVTDLVEYVGFFALNTAISMPILPQGDPTER